jgi:hypothetical protein
VSTKTLTPAERARARYSLLTTGQVAARLSEADETGRKIITGDTVRAWCAAGWIRCSDGRLPGTGRPYYLMEWSAVVEFIENGGAAAFVKDESASDAA